MSIQQQRDQIADLVLGHLEGSHIASALTTDASWNENDTTHRFVISDGAERYGVSITLSRLTPVSAAAKGEA